MFAGNYTVHAKVTHRTPIITVKPNSATPEPVDGKPAKTLRARAHLLVTVPVYMPWELRGGTQ